MLFSMNFIKKFSIFILPFLFLTSFPLHAIHKVYSIKGCYSIVADSNKWTCEYTRYYTRVVGKHRQIPLEFHFSFTNSPKNKGGKYEGISAAEDILTAEAMRTTTVFSDISLAEERESFFLFTGNYFDNASSGYFAFYLFKNPNENNEKNQWYEMLVKLGNDSINESKRNAMFQDTYQLIKSVVNIKS